MAKEEFSLITLFIKSTLLSFFFVFVFFAITLLALLFYVYQKSILFTNAAGTTLPQLIEVARLGLATTPKQDDGQVRFLILGSDELPNRDRTSVLTDTILVASLDLKTAKIGLFSLPRDIWIPQHQQKINKLYNSGTLLGLAQPQQLLQQEVQSLTGLSIHHTIVVQLDTLSQLVDLVGGVDVEIKEGFTDPLFPRTDVDVTTTNDSKLLYETVSFASGSAHMSGSEVLKYVRSRHATNEQGSDNARGNRQQTVILALIEKLKNPSFWKDLARNGRLYQFYMSEFNQYLPLTEAIGIGRKIWPQLGNLQFSIGTPSVYPAQKNGVIYHPEGGAVKYFGAWVYEVKDARLFQSEAQKTLYLVQ